MTGPDELFEKEIVCLESSHFYWSAYALPCIAYTEFLYFKSYFGDFFSGVLIEFLIVWPSIQLNKIRISRVQGNTIDSLAGLDPAQVLAGI